MVSHGVAINSHGVLGVPRVLIRRQINNVVYEELVRPHSASGHGGTACREHHLQSHSLHEQSTNQKEFMKTKKSINKDKAKGKTEWTRTIYRKRSVQKH